MHRKNNSVLAAINPDQNRRPYGSAAGCCDGLRLVPLYGELMTETVLSVFKLRQVEGHTGVALHSQQDTIPGRLFMLPASAAKILFSPAEIKMG